MSGRMGTARSRNRHETLAALTADENLTLVGFKGLDLGLRFRVQGCESCTNVKVAAVRVSI